MTIASWLKSDRPPRPRVVPDAELVMNARWRERIGQLFELRPRRTVRLEPMNPNGSSLANTTSAPILPWSVPPIPPLGQERVDRLLALHHLAPLGELAFVAAAHSA